MTRASPPQLATTAMLDGQIAIVTGAARGIGRAIALTLAQEGATVVVADVDAKGSEDTADAARRSSAQSMSYDVDITDHDQIKRLATTVEHKFGRIDILVNNAGVTRQIDFFAVTPQDMDWILNVNVKGSFFMMQAVAVAMKRAGAGRIVNISSIAGKGYRNTSNICYAGSKGALIAMTRIAAAQLGPYGITVNSICPGLTETDMMTDWLARRSSESQKSIDVLKQEMTSDIALRRINSVSDIAASVLFMVSPAAANITGQSLNVDGGLVWD